MSNNLATQSTFGNWRRRRSAGLWSLGLLGTAVLFGSMGLAVLLSVVNLAASGVVVLGALLVLVPLISVKHGRNGFQALLTHV